VQSYQRTSKRRRHRHRRICANCEQVLDSLTIKCPRCDLLTPRPVHLVTFTAFATLIVVALLKSLELL
jgi:hypothetical protein